MAGLILITTAVSFTAAAPDQFEYFLYIPESAVNKDISETYCRVQYEGELVSLHSDNERQTVASMIRSIINAKGFSITTRFWTGLGRIGLISPDTDANWGWSDSTTFSSSSDGGVVWASGEPNFYRNAEYCGNVDQDGKLNDARCNTLLKGAVCKRPARSTTTMTAAAATTTTTTITSTTTMTTSTNPNPFLARNWYPRAVVSDTCYYKYFNVVLYKQLTSNTRKTWTEAQHFCQTGTDFPSNLTSIGSHEEQQFITSMIYDTYKELKNRPVWLGAQKVGRSDRAENSQWAWIDGSPTFTPKEGYSNFRFGEPNNDKWTAGVMGEDEHCLQMTHSKEGIQGEWNDAACSRKRGYVCKICVPTGSEISELPGRKK